MDAKLKSAVENAIKGQTGNAFEISVISSVGGGCINQAAKISDGKSSFFIKWNNRDRFPGMFQKEANGLQKLREANAIYIPEVITVDESTEIAFIIQEWIEPGARKVDFWENFGRNLAQLHKTTNSYYGFKEDNYIGSLPQVNTQTANWNRFFIQYRLMPQVQMAHRAQKLELHHLKQFDKLYEKLDHLIPVEKPSLLHGDLWSGNFLTGADGEVALIDPAVYFGHREAEIAFTQLFGGFNQWFYDAYNENHPLQPGWQHRTDIFNLYPLLVHVNLFGGSYLRQVEEILMRSI